MKKRKKKINPESRFSKPHYSDVKSNKNYGPDLEIDKEIVRNVTQERQRKEEDPFLNLIYYDQNMAVGYLARKAPETFGNALRTLMEIKYRFPYEAPRTLLDFGAGTGSLGAAFVDVFPDHDFVVNVEKSDPMRKLGRYMTQDIKENMVWVPDLSSTLQFDHHPHYDLVSVSNVLEEIPTPEQRMEIIESLWEKVSPGGFFIIMEPGSPMGFRFINDTRNLMRKKGRKNANIVAPCPHQNECPLAKKKNIW